MTEITDADALERAALRQMKKVLLDHHQWHLGQTDEDQHGVIPAEAYCESRLYDTTVCVLGVANLLLTDGLMSIANALPSPEASQ